MKSIARTVLFSTALLATACMKEPTSTPAAGQPTPAVQQPQTPAAAAPAPKAPLVDEALVPAAAPAPTPAPAPAPTAAPSVADLGKMLAGIKDTATATAAKAPLEAIVLQLQTAKNAAPAATTTDALGGIGKLVGDAAAKMGVSPEIMKQITGLMDNASVKAAIGPTLEKLQGLLK